MKNRQFCNLTIIFAIAFLLACSAISRALARPLETFITDAGLFNPAKGPLVIRYQLFKDAEEVEARIFDFQGQVVDSFVFVSVNAGDHSLSWDGTDNNGERVLDGRHQIRITAELGDGTTDAATVDVMVAWLKDPTGVQAPEPLPAAEFPYTVSGSLSTFYRHNEEISDADSGEVRFRTSVDYRKDETAIRGSVQAIQEFEEDSPSLDGTQMMVERMWQGGNGRAVYHDNLGDFNDLFQLFSDFRTEREKIGVSARHTIGGFNTTGVVFTTETEDVESEERGAAARLSYGDGRSLLLGSSITYRKALEAGESRRKNDSHAISADLRYAATDSFSMAAQVVATDDDTAGKDYGGGIKGEYDLGPLRLSTGYTDLGENFKADFADPLHNVERDARGFDAGVDYFMLEPIWFFSSFSSTLHVFNLTRHSDDSTVEEIDGSLRFGIGERDSFFISVFRREDEFGRSTNYMASATHKWNEIWTNRLQTNYAETDESDSLRLNVATSYKKDDTFGRLSLEWSKRDIYYSKFSPYKQSYVRFDLGKRFWHLQIQGRYTDSDKENGMNLFGRLDYKPLFWHRYQIVTYLSLGNRSAVETEKQIEIGIEVQF